MTSPCQPAFCAARLTHQRPRTGIAGERKMNVININGIHYIVVSEKPFSHNGKQRTVLTLRLPKGKRHYEAVIYENGSISEVV
jgi:hypothetical protein